MSPSDKVSVKSLILGTIKARGTIVSLCNVKRFVKSNMILINPHAILNMPSFEL